MRCRGQEEGKDALFRKRKVLQLVSHWSRLNKDFLRDEEHVKGFMKVRAVCPCGHTQGIDHRTISSLLKDQQLDDDQACIGLFYVAHCVGYPPPRVETESRREESDWTLTASNEVMDLEV